MERVRVLGVAIDPVDRVGMLEMVRGFVQENARRTVAYANIHVLNTAQNEAELRRFLSQVDLCYCDGEGVRLGARILGKSLPERMTGADWIWDLGKMAQQESWTLGWLGGEPGVTAEAARVLEKRFGGLRIVTEHGFFEKEGPENDAVIAGINAVRPQILLVGMGTPIQEKWVLAQREKLQVPVVWVIGATADFVSGKVRRGPEFLHQRQEWLARLLVDPRRLWRRYLLGNTLFMGRVLKERLIR